MKKEARDLELSAESVAFLKMLREQKYIKLTDLINRSGDIFKIFFVYRVALDPSYYPVESMVVIAFLVILADVINIRLKPRHNRNTSQGRQFVAGYMEQAVPEPDLVTIWKTYGPIYKLILMTWGYFGPDKDKD